ncbi:MAG: HNH endonuclease [Deltaproteobacteria bacterium]|nr:HNH endonuclease [Deltaproteobacteria bacterium]
MANEIIPYIEMCRREGMSLQRGMNFGLGKNHSIILTSVRPGSPYADRYENDGSTIVYEGHDIPRSPQTQNPKAIDQPEFSPSGNCTENGKFHLAAQEYKAGRRRPERIRVYEKLKQGIWSYNGVFHLVDSWQEENNGRKVFKFKLIAVEGEEDFSVPVPEHSRVRRIIPTAVKLAVWQRDGGKCTKCGTTEDLHFDHIIPWSKGGSSNTSDNVQLLCGKHNLQKHDRIE